MMTDVTGAYSEIEKDKHQAMMARNKDSEILNKILAKFDYMSTMNKAHRDLRWKNSDKEHDESFKRYLKQITASSTAMFSALAVAGNLVGLCQRSIYPETPLVNAYGYAVFPEVAALTSFGLFLHFNGSLEKLGRKINHWKDQRNERRQYGKELVRSTKMPPQHKCVPDALYREIRLSRLAQAKRAQEKTA